MNQPTESKTILEWFEEARTAGHEWADAAIENAWAYGTAEHKRQSDFVGEEKAAVLAVLYQKIPIFRLTGSISLIEWGVCQRPVSDIDIVVETFDEIWAISGSFPVDYDFDYTDDMEHSPILKSVGHEREPLIFALRPLPNRAHFQIGGVKCCVFLGKDQEAKMCQIAGLDFLVSHPRYAVEAKRKYLKDLEEIETQKPLTEFQQAKRAKHLADVLAYENWEKAIGD